ncbi:unnamed protein product [Phytophthora fragariaefolia]|uniref:Unnamed protein product n=1 Tax=Phytophthora fragariaefolia TaxID=1490495 RepID=A0A9W7CYE6_9STRA|nr:unnamed protein product [Phytophthora fragariaefolia]
MDSNQYEDKETRTPAATPAVQDAHYHDETALRLDVTTPEAENKKEEEDIPLDKNGRPMVKFIRWRVSRRRRWFIIIGLILLFLVIALLVMYFAIIPAIIRHYMDKMVLSINYMDVIKIPSDTEIDVTFSVNLQYDVPASATTDPVTASPIYNGLTFGTAGVVGQHIMSGKQNYNLTMNTTMVISDVDTFNAMSEAMMQEETVPITMSAKVDAHAWGLPFNNIKFERTLDLVGFNNFADIDPEVQHIDLWGCSDGVWYEMDVNASVNNPSAMGLQGIGVLNMSVYYNDTYLGFAYSQKPDLGMPRGLSNQTFRVVMLEASPALQGVITRFLGDGGVTVSARGDNPHLQSILNSRRP